MSEIAIDVKNLSAKMGEYVALDDLTLQVPKKSFVAIVGPNGAGKTTFLKVLLGLVPSLSGYAKVFGREPLDVPAQWLGYVPQVKTMDRNFPALAIELVMTGLDQRWPWRKRTADYRKAQEALEHAGAFHLAYRKLGKLSGGELQRICIARSIVRNPKIVMLDEPATGIDAVGEADMYRMLEDYQSESGATLLMITHDWHVATHHADRVLLLNCKQISYGAPREALSEDCLRKAFGHIGHKHELKFLLDSDD